jgi:hypothetical protein
MHLVVDDLLCPSCSGYVHPFLERCPACGADRAGRFDDAVTSGALGAQALLVDEATERAAHFVVLRYSLRSASQTSLAKIDAAFRLVAGSLAYRASVAADGPTPALPGGTASVDSATVVLAEGSLEVRGGPSGRAIAAIPLDSVLAATPITKGVPGAEVWAGARLGTRRLLERRPLSGGDLLVTFASGGAAGQLALANRRGLLAPSARPDHYVTLARWIAILGAAAAEARWTAVGPAAYARELGLGEAGAGSSGSPEVAAGGLHAAPAEARPATAAASPATAAASTAPTAAASPDREGAGAPAADRGAGTTGVRAALEQLEELRAAGLVTPGEYDAKRREILARL